MYFVIEETGVASYNDSRFYDSDENFDASIYVKGQNDIQTIMTHDSERNINYMYGKQGGALYTNLDSTMPTISNKTTIVVKTFGDDDTNNQTNKLNFAVTVRTEQTQKFVYYYGTNKDDEISDKLSAYDSSVYLSGGRDIIIFTEKNTVTTLEHYNNDVIILTGNQSDYILILDNVGRAKIYNKKQQFLIIINNGNLFKQSNSLDENNGLVKYV